MTDSRGEYEHGSLKWLLSLDQERFVGAAYEVILGRPADRTGVRHYASVLEKKNGRIQIIADLYYSREAKKRQQRNDISDAALRYKHPLRSRIIRLLQADKYSFPATIAAPPSSPNSHAVTDVQFEKILDAINIKGNEIQAHLLQLEYKLSDADQPEPQEILGNSGTRYLFNLSTSNHWQSHAVGIIRVEREIASYMRRFRNVEYVLWDAQARCLKKLARVHADRILAPEWCSPSSGRMPYNPAHLAEAAISAGDVYVSLGLDWDHAPTSQVLRFLKPFDAKAILACFDTVPTQFPEFLVREEIAAEFRQHLVDMAHGSTKVWAISQATKRDLVRFWESAQLERDLPEVFTAPLASYARGAKLPSLNEQDHALLREIFGKGEFVLYVSSVEPRKNHKLMLNIWRELWSKRGVDCPLFLYVGMMGWGSEDMLQQISRMAVYAAGKINGLHQVSDNLLAHLYHHCAFTVFPSLYEGWGLAATEAMGFGKVCVVADNSSLGEATQNLMPAYHPLDFPGWKAEIERLLDDLPYRQSLENRISAEYEPLTWRDVGEKFCANIVLDPQK